MLCDGAGGSTAVARSAAASARAGWQALQRLRREPRLGADPHLLEQFRARLLRRRGPVPLLDHTLLACCWDRRRLLVLGASPLVLAGCGFALRQSGDYPFKTVLAGFALAWTAGLVLPGAPGGLGVFEAVLLLRLAVALPQASLLSVVA